MSRISLQVLRFAVVGAAATITHVAAAVTLVEGVGLRPVPANVLAFCGALLVSYAGSAWWTFAAKGAHGRLFPRFTAVALVGLALNHGIMYAVVDLLRLDYRLGLAVVVSIVPGLSFLLHRTWSFRPNGP